MEEIGATIPISTNHCVFYGAHCATTHDEPSFPALFNPFTRELVPLLFEESITRSSSKLVQPVFWYSLIKSFLPQKFFWRGSHFFLHCFIFIAHFFVGLRELAWIPEGFFKLSFVHALVCLITHSFPHGFQPNLYQHFSHVCSTCHTIISLK